MRGLGQSSRHFMANAPPAPVAPTPVVALLDPISGGTHGAAVRYACAHLTPTWSWADSLGERLTSSPEAGPGPWREAADAALAIALGVRARPLGAAVEVALSEQTAPEVFQALDALGVTVERWAPSSTPAEVLAAGRARGPLMRDRVPGAFQSAAIALLEACGPFQALVCGDVLGPLAQVAGQVARARGDTASVVRVQPEAGARWLAALCSPWRPAGGGAGWAGRDLAIGDRTAAEAQRRVARRTGLLLDLASAATVEAAHQLAATLPPEATVVALVLGAGEREFSVSELLLK